MLADSMAQLEIRGLGIENCELAESLDADAEPVLAGQGGALSVSRMRSSDALYIPAVIEDLLIEHSSARVGAAVAVDVRSPTETQLSQLVALGLDAEAGAVLYYPDPAAAAGAASPLTEYQNSTSGGRHLQCIGVSTGLDSADAVWQSRTCEGGGAAQAACDGCVLDSVFGP